jgi:hypothetical protein
MARKHSLSRPHLGAGNIPLHLILSIIVVGAALNVIAVFGLSGVAQILALPTGRLGGVLLAVVVVSVAGVVDSAAATLLLVSWRKRQDESRFAQATDALEALDELYRTTQLLEAAGATAPELHSTREMVRQVETVVQSITGGDTRPTNRLFDYDRVLGPLPTFLDGLASMFDFPGALTSSKLDTLLPPDLATHLAMESSWRTVNDTLSNAVQEALEDTVHSMQSGQDEQAAHASL